MAIFDDIEKKIAETGQSAVKKGKDIADVAKLNSSISEREKNVNNLYSQLGRTVYESGVCEQEPNCGEYINSIRQNIWQIAQYKDQIKMIRRIATCPNCAADIPYGVPFCSSCGYKIEIKAPQAGEVCPICKKAVRADQKFCTGCGNKLTSD